MALVFSLSVECEKADDASAVAAHFGRLRVEFADDEAAVCQPSLNNDPEGGWWVMVCVPGMTTNAPISDMRSKERMTEAAHQLLDHLRRSPSFRYAMVGVEVDHFRCFGEIDNDLAELPFDGVVVSDAIWARLGWPAVFEPFADGYRWRPYAGETSDL